MMRRRPRLPAITEALNLLLAVAFGSIAVAEVWLVDYAPIGTTTQIVVTVLVLGTAATIAVRDNFPWQAFVANTLLVITVVATGYTGDAHAWTNLVMLYTVAAIASTRRSIVAAAASMGSIAFYFSNLDSRRDGAVAVFAALIWSIGWLAGRMRRSAQITTDLAAVGAAQQIALDRQQERLDLAASRTRLAREVHDLVGHTVNVMVVHASAGRRATDPARTRQALETIEATGRQALVELDRTVRALRSDDEPFHDDPGDLKPGLPGLDQLEALISQMNSVGNFRVSLSMPTAYRAVPTEIGFSAYRIVQESLTNVLKHSTATAVMVTAKIDASAVSVSIADNGETTAPAWTPGRGLQGMEERAELHGGTLTITPGVPCGAQVHAVLPLRSGVA